MDKDEEIILDPDARFVRTYDYLNYSHHRIKQILRDYYNYRLENIWQGYKANRRPGYTEIYRLIDNATGNIVYESVTLHFFRRRFAQVHFPLHEEETNRNTGAEAFLEAVDMLQNRKVVKNYCQCHKALKPLEP